MSGRKQKTERKKKEKKEEKPQVFFEGALLAFLRSVGQAAGGIKNRSGGAQQLGADAMFVCATESLDLARNSAPLPSATGVQGYISAAAYSLVAAMIQAGAWNLTPKPTSESKEAPPDDQEKGADQ